MPEITGSCLCGAVRCKTTATPVLVGIFIAGIARSSPAVRSAFWSGYRDGFKLRGTVKSYSKPADSGRPIVRRFCPECGFSIAEEPGSRPDLVVLNGGTLDDLNSLTLAMQIYCERELSWVRLDRTQSRARHDGDLSIQIQETSGAHLRREVMAWSIAPQLT
jgi:hypothetical protein